VNLIVGTTSDADARTIADERLNSRVYRAAERTLGTASFSFHFSVLVDLFSVFGHFLPPRV